MRHRILRPLIWVYTVCSDLFVQIHMVNTVHIFLTSPWNLCCGNSVELPQCTCFVETKISFFLGENKLQICQYDTEGPLTQTQAFCRKWNWTRAGVCKTLCPQLPDSNTVWLQHCLAMTVTTAQIYDFNVILSKGNNSKIGDDWDKKKIWITYFFMRNQNMKFQNISIHGSKLMLYTIKQRH